MSVRRRQWVCPWASRRKPGSWITATSTATGTSRPSPRNAMPMPIMPSSAPRCAPEPIPPTARASPSPRPPSYGWPPAMPPGWSAQRSPPIASMSSCTSCRYSEALQLSQLTVPLVRDFEDRLRKDGRSPAMVRKAAACSARSSPMPRSAASWRRTSCSSLRTSRRGQDGAPSGNGKLKVGVDIPAPDEIRAIVARHLDGPLAAAAPDRDFHRAAGLRAARPALGRRRPRSAAKSTSASGPTVTAPSGSRNRRRASAPCRCRRWW